MHDWKDEVERAIAGLGMESARQEAIAEEMAQHLSERYDELLRSGMDEVRTYAAVMNELNEEKLRAELRPMFRKEAPPVVLGGRASGGFWAGLGKDMRLAVRQLRNNPGFAAVSLLSLALGVGANTAIFELIDAVVLRTLPVPNPDQLAEVRLMHGGRNGSTVARQKEFSTAIWEQLDRQQQGFSSVAAWSTESFDLGHGGEARNADGMWVSGSFFGALDLEPTLGRLLSPADDVKGCGIQGAVISYGFWQREFGGRADVIGRTVSLDRAAFQIVGITPQTFKGLEVGRKFDVAVPLCSEAALHAEGAWSKDATTWWLAAIGRLKSGWGPERAAAQLGSVAPGIFSATLPPRYDAAQKKDYLRFGFRVDPAGTGDSPLRKQYEAPLFVLLAISGLVLLIACANIANLMLTRASMRQQEMALRIALGASRSRIGRQLLVESLVLAVMGTAAGAMLAFLLGKALVMGIGTTQNQIYLPLTPDWRMLAFTTVVALSTCVVFGVAPALQAASAKPSEAMKSAGRTLTEARSRFLLRRGFIVAQMSISLMLVVAALLFVRTFRNLVNMNAGFEQQGILIAGFDSWALNIAPAARLEYKRELLEQVRAIPGVDAAAETSIVPLTGDGWNEYMNIPERGVHRALVDFSQVSSDYFQTLEIPMLEGRDFDRSDTVNSPPVAIVNRAFTKAFLGNGGAVGHTFRLHHDDATPDTVYRIVGMVGNTRYRDVHEDVVPIAFVSASQDRTPDLGSTILIRSSEETPVLIAQLKETAAKKSAEIVLSFTVMRTVVRDELSRERMMAELSGFYGALAALLAAVGLYGILSFSVARRKPEIGIRMALGATRRRILALVLREALVLLGLGVTGGIAMTLAAGRTVQSLLYGVNAADPLTIAAAVAGMAMVALVASLVPAQRAASVQPMQTLRSE